jgi:hypothetical protein
MPAPAWLIEGLFEVNSLVMVAGPPGNFKSFLAIDWVLSMAVGRKWHTRPTCPSKVLYCLGEGKSNLIKRIQAWAHYYNLNEIERRALVSNFRVTFDVPQLASKSSVDNMLAGLAAEDFAPNVIVMDTFARSFVGLDENSQQDTGLWIESADRLRQLGYTVIFLHHTAKNTEFGLKYRGSTAIMGAMDSAFTLQKDRDIKTYSKLECVKQKDHDEGDPIYFQRVIVRPNASEEGSIVLTPTVKMDEGFTEQGQANEFKIEATLTKLVDDSTFDSDRARARELSRLTGLTEAAAQTRVSRVRQKKPMPHSMPHPQSVENMELN